jgi:hypothetical protein
VLGFLLVYLFIDWVSSPTMGSIRWSGAVPSTDWAAAAAATVLQPQRPSVFGSVGSACVAAGLPGVALLTPATPFSPSAMRQRAGQHLGVRCCATFASGPPAGSQVWCPAVYLAVQWQCRVSLLLLYAVRGFGRQPRHLPGCCCVNSSQCSGHAAAAAAAAAVQAWAAA